MLTACPYSSPFKLDNEPVVSVDDWLIGRWVSQSPGTTTMIIEKINAEEFHMNFTGNLQSLSSLGIIHDDTLKGKGFISIVAKKQVINFEIKGLTYIAEIFYNNEQLSLFPLNEHFTAKLIRSNASLRKAVEVHLNTRVKPLYDMDFALVKMIRQP